MKLPIAFAMLLIASNVNAQRSAPLFHQSPVDASSSASVRNFIDTIRRSSFIPVNEGGLGCFTGYYHSPDSGYVSGNNQYGDLEKAQFFSLTQMGFAKGATVQNVQVRFAYKTVGEQPEDIFVKIYDSDTSALAPKNLLGTSSGISVSSIAVDGQGTLFTFPEPFTVTDSFFVSVQLPDSTGDTLVIQSTNDNCVSHVGWSWELWSNETWHTLINSWILNIDLAIFPVADVETLSGIGEVNGNEMISVFPNPASDHCTISLGNKTGASNILIEDLTGRIVKDSGKVNSENMTIDLSSLPEGIYFILVPNQFGWQRKQICVAR